MSLREQLLKAGLVSEEKAKKVESAARKKAHQVKKDKALGAAEAAKQAEEQRKLKAEEEHKRERDRQLNREREAEKKRREIAARAFQLIESNRLNERDADSPYHFLEEGRYIRRVRVTPQQRKLLAMGRIGIVYHEADEYDYSLISRKTAVRLAEFAPERILLLYDENEAEESEQ